MAKYHTKGKNLTYISLIKFHIQLKATTEYWSLSSMEERVNQGFYIQTDFPSNIQEKQFEHTKT